MCIRGVWNNSLPQNLFGPKFDASFLKWNFARPLFLDKIWLDFFGGTLNSAWPLFSLTQQFLDPIFCGPNTFEPYFSLLTHIYLIHFQKLWFWEGKCFLVQSDTQKWSSLHAYHSGKRWAIGWFSPIFFLDETKWLCPFFTYI